MSDAPLDELKIKLLYDLLLKSARADGKVNIAEHDQINSNEYEAI